MLSEWDLWWPVLVLLLNGGDNSGWQPSTQAKQIFFSIEETGGREVSISRFLYPQWKGFSSFPVGTGSERRSFQWEHWLKQNSCVPGKGRGVGSNLVASYHMYGLVSGQDTLFCFHVTVYCHGLVTFAYDTIFHFSGCCSRAAEVYSGVHCYNARQCLPFFIFFQGERSSSTSSN